MTGARGRFVPSPVGEAVTTSLLISSPTNTFYICIYIYVYYNYDNRCYILQQYIYVLTKMHIHIENI